jgi:hypothetical protein
METRKLSISLGLLALVALHAILLRAPLPNMQPPIEPRIKSFSFDTIEQNIANPASNRVNASARDEVKHQQPNCIDCKSPSASPINEVKGQSKPGKAYNLDVFVSNDAQSKAILGFFNSYPALTNLKSKCNYQVYAPGDELFKQRYSQWIPASQFPAILLTRSDGGHIYVASKSEIPSTADGLHRAIYEAEKAAIEAYKLTKQSNSPESDPNCVDGTCKKPPFWNRDKDEGDKSLSESRSRSDATHIEFPAIAGDWPRVRRITRHRGRGNRPHLQEKVAAWPSRFRGNQPTQRPLPMFIIAIVALAVAVLYHFSRKPPTASGPSPILDVAQLVRSSPSYPTDEPKPERRIQLLSQRLQEVADERLMNDTLEDLGLTRSKPARPTPAP